MGEANEIEKSAGNWPEMAAHAIVKVSKELTPNFLKAADRRIAGVVDIPIAWLAQKRASIESQTASFSSVEKAVAAAAVLEIEGDRDTAARAVEVLLRRSYREQQNRTGVALAMIEELRDQSEFVEDSASGDSIAEIEDDWLNVFERYADHASSDRMRTLWGKILAGEIRRPGRFSLRTLRALSEFSQQDALDFEKVAAVSFGGFAPRSLVYPPDREDISELIFLEANGIIKGIDVVIVRKFDMNSTGQTYIREDDNIIMLYGEPGAIFELEVIVLTPLGQQLTSLVEARHWREAATNLARALRGPTIRSARLAQVDSSDTVNFVSGALWED